MKASKFIARSVCLLALTILPSCSYFNEKERSFTPLEHAHFTTKPALEQKLAEKGLNLGDPVLIRAFKSEMQMELWVRNETTGTYDLFQTYPICRASGTLGPKIKEGDRQAPEGFYTVAANQLNPNSKYHLALNIGYPNAYDRAHKRAGSALMIHGDCVSAGCLAVTDNNISEIYLMAEESLTKNPELPIPVHIFPFRMTEEKMSLRRYSEWYPFWKNLKQGYDFFKTYHIPPQVTQEKKRYVFNTNGKYY
ncbi:MAG: murein L,D-transpeptidase [Alphaproteobacteria bacterium]|nr:murein L,D-transpeptidase [Alphaproteobacteria bacterium]